MARSSWSVPVVIGVVGLAWIGFLGWDIWATPDAGRPTEAELAAAVGQAVGQRDASGLQQLFTARDLPASYAEDYLTQVPEGARVTTRTGTDSIGPLLTVQVQSINGARCTTWRVDADSQRASLAAGPVLTGPCESG